MAVSGVGRRRQVRRVGPFGMLLSSIAVVAIRTLVPHRDTSPPSPSVPPDPGGPKGMLVRIGRRPGFGWLGRTLDVQQRFGEVHGGNLAAAFTLQAFLSLFPLLLVGAAAAGFFQASGTDVSGRIIGELGLTGTAADTVRESLATAAASRQATSVIGLVGLLWSGLGVVAALQHAYNEVWKVEDRGLKDKAIGFAWLLGAVIVFVASAAVTTALRWLPGALAPVGVVATFVTTLLLWVWTQKWLPNVRLSVRDVLPGAVLGTIGLEALKFAGAYWVPRTVASSSQLYGTIGVVFAVLAWLLLFGRLIVYTACLNVTLHERRVVGSAEHEQRSGSAKG